MYYTLFIICHWFGPPAGDFQSIWEAVPGDRTISQKAEPDGDGLTVHLPECPLYEELAPPRRGGRKLGQLRLGELHQIGQLFLDCSGTVGISLYRGS